MLLAPFLKARQHQFLLDVFTEKSHRQIFKTVTILATPTTKSLELHIGARTLGNYFAQFL